MNVLEFQSIVRTKRSALTYLRAFCWPDGSLACPKCGVTKVYRIKNERYRCSACKYSFTDFSMRWFGLLRLEPQQLLWLVKLFKLQLTALECSKQLGSSYGMKSRDGDARMEVMRGVSSSSLLEAIGRNVEKGSMIYTDKFKAHDDLKAFGYRHRKINHRKRFVCGKTHTNGVEGLWSYVKEGMIKHHGVSREKFGLYLAEQEFRFNHRNESLFKLLVEKMCNLVPRNEWSPIFIIPVISYRP